MRFTRSIILYYYFLFFFFFFQAEDGIRDGTVTGVQTCALPICRRTIRMLLVEEQALAPHQDQQHGNHADQGETVRSEEHTSELQSQFHLVCRLLLEKKKKKQKKS